jgi:quaternary ammonium compound-resistance protein SugE
LLAVDVPPVIRLQQVELIVESSQRRSGSIHQQGDQRRTTMAWMFLVLAGVCEIGWPVGLKLGWSADGARWAWIIFAVVCMTASGGFLLLAQREIPMGTAYAVWTGIGAVGAFFVGISAFGDASSAMRFLAVGLIVAGIVGLRLA